MHFSLVVATHDLITSNPPPTQPPPQLGLKRIEKSSHGSSKIIDYILPYRACLLFCAGLQAKRFTVCMFWKTSTRISEKVLQSSDTIGQVEVGS